jgi:hypothetical protein
VAQISVISSLRVKHFKIAHWDHFGFNPIVKTACAVIDGRRSKNPVAMMLTLPAPSVSSSS